MYRYLKYLPSILIIAFWLIPESSIAQGGFVNCEGNGCSACNLVDMTNNIIKWLLGMIFIIFAALMTVAGFGLVTSGGNPSALSAAKAKFTNALIGIVIVFSAWLIVNTIMVKLVSDGTTAGNITGWGPWSQVQCQEQAKSISWSRSATDANPVAEVTPPAVGLPAGTLTHAAALASLGSNFSVRSSGNCSNAANASCTSLDGIRELTITRIKELQTAVGVPFIVTGGTEANHAPGPYSHANGYKMDIQPNNALNQYISTNSTFTKIGTTRWKDARGNIYYRHAPDHWDILITN